MTDTTDGSTGEAREGVVDATSATPEPAASQAAETAATTPEAPAGASPADIQIAAAEKAIRRLQADKAALEARIGTYQDRITKSPTRGTDLDKLTRDLDQFQTDYDRWTASEIEAQRSLDLELAQQGEQFKIEVTAGVPALPAKPIPSQVILTGLDPPTRQRPHRHRGEVEAHQQQPPRGIDQECSRRLADAQRLGGHSLGRSLSPSLNERYIS